MTDNNSNISSPGFGGSAAAAFGIGRERNNMEPIEDLPPMRAVAVLSQPPALQTITRDNDLRFGKAPPLGIVRPGPIGKPRIGLKREASAGLSVQQEWSGVTAKWDVKDLEPVPLDFPLERTHREIRGADGAEVAKRISAAIKKLSIDVEYDGPKAKAKCRTNDLVSFRIRLFAGGEGGLPVMVEIQRRNGSPSSFMRSCRSILAAAEGTEIDVGTTQSRKKMPSFMKGPVGGMKCLQSAVLKADPVADMEKGMGKALELLRAKQKDTNLLGLESMCQTTDPIKTRPDIATMASKKVLLDESSREIREEVAVMLQRDVFTPEEVEEEDAPLTHADKSCHMALVLFSNALALTSKDGCLEAAVKSQSWFSEFLIPSLLDEVKKFETSGNNAYEAVCGLTSLASCSEVARRVMQENAAMDDLKAAQAYGNECHELLANETERCLEALGSST